MTETASNPSTAAGHKAAGASQSHDGRAAQGVSRC